MEEEIKRDLERAEEYEQTIVRVSAIGKNMVNYNFYFFK
jgi:hypothetical protein